MTQELLLNHYYIGDVLKILKRIGGAGTTAMVSAKQHRNFIYIDINKHYAAMSKKRLEKELGMFNPVAAGPSQPSQREGVKTVTQ